MLEAVSTPRNRTRSLVLLMICGAAAVAAGFVGIDDNLPGILLAFGATAALVLSVVHPWRTPKQFAGLLVASFLGAVICGVLHNLFEVLAGRVTAAHALQILLQVLSVTTFLLAVLIGPPAILVGATGMVVMLIRRYRQPTRRS